MSPVTEPARGTLSYLKVLLMPPKSRTFLALLALLACSVVHAETGEPKVDEVLDRLHQLGVTMKDFQADVRLSDEDDEMGTSTSRIGKVWYQTTGDGDARIRVNLTAKIEEDGAKMSDRVEYLLDDGWLIDRTYSRKIQVKRQVSRPDEKINLLKLGEGPFPLPIGQDKAEVHKLFDATLAPPQGDDPNGTTHLVLKPKPGTQFSEKFKVIDVWVDDQTAMPRQMRTADTKGNVKKTNLDNVSVNPGLNDSDFTLEPVQNWNMTTEKFEE
jgi:hypothetical protein